MIKTQNKHFDKITCILCNKTINIDQLKHNCKLRNLNITLQINNNKLIRL